MTTTEQTELENVVFTEQVTYIATDCPDWCNLHLMHQVDNVYDDGRMSRIHGGPRWGRFLSAFGEEFTNAPGQLEIGIDLCSIDDQLTPSVEDLRQLAADALAAAEWLEAHQ